jgi:hypothetical protein
MSSNTRVVLVAVAMIAAGGCVDSKSTFEEYAAPVICQTGVFANLTGEHFMVVTNGSPLAANRLVLIATVSGFAPSADGSATADFSLQPLSVTSKEEVGDPLEDNDVVIGSNGALVLDIVGTIEGAANPVSGQRIDANITICGASHSADFWCGDVTGMVNAGADLTLADTTFGAIRVPTGTRGDDLPDDSPGACTTPVDAGP